MPTLEKLETLNPRTHWPDEAADFTPWVASPEGLQLIGEALNLDLETLSSSSEVPVGRYRADVVCIDTSTSDNSLVLIENQLAPTDHNHVGQVLTYAAGLDAVTIIWIASEFREEHTAAIEWLNRITNERYCFFGLEIGLVKIGDCGPAATLSVVAKPNSWSRGVKQSAESGRYINENGRLHLKFWTAYIENTGIKGKKAQPEQWFTVGFGTKHAHIGAARLVQSRSLRVAIILPSDFRDHYMLALKSQQDEIEKDLGRKLEFVKKLRTNSIEVTEDMDPRDESDWPRQVKWIIETLASFDRAFRNRLQDIDPEDWQIEVDQLDDPT